ncbi:helix-turn-helix domain-containing protein [Streptomyces nitrosporeus]|uniref:helix-turn-helix domain-containing protein n=1 Tax=Streptomyces nitrosporeus TaxID=28894 RepID=UPI00332D2D3B
MPCGPRGTAVGPAGAAAGSGRGGEDRGMTRPMLTQREAAAACGVSRTTIRRHREAGDLPGAVQDQARGRLIPVEGPAGCRVPAERPGSTRRSSPPHCPGQPQPRCRREQQPDRGRTPRRARPPPGPG